MEKEFLMHPMLGPILFSRQGGLLAVLSQSNQSIHLWDLERLQQGLEGLGIGSRLPRWPALGAKLGPNSASPTLVPSAAPPRVQLLLEPAAPVKAR
jgi:hypothetical protein